MRLRGEVHGANLKTKLAAGEGFLWGDEDQSQIVKNPFIHPGRGRLFLKGVMCCRGKGSRRPPVWAEEPWTLEQ